MKLAINYSTSTAELVRTKNISADYFKCPAWPNLIPRAQEILPTYIHLPLKAGSGIGDATDTETGQAANWEKIEKLLAQTETPFVNVHLAPYSSDFPKLPADTTVRADTEMLTEYLIKDVRRVVSQIGAERVILENDCYSRGLSLRPALLPQVITRVVEETRCGLLLDLAHARISAAYLDMDVKAYINELPLSRLREVHITGVQPLLGHWAELVREVDAAGADRLANGLFDHLPMVEEDWRLIEWSLQQIRTGAWSQPWVIAFEYGGVGPLWEMLTDPQVLGQQVPRLRNLLETV